MLSRDRNDTAYVEMNHINKMGVETTRFELIFSKDLL